MTHPWHHSHSWRPSGQLLFLHSFILYVRSIISQPLDEKVNLSYFADDIAIWAQSPGICNTNLRLQKIPELNFSSVSWVKNQMEPRKNLLYQFSRRRVIKDTSITTYGQPLKVIQSLQFLGVHIDNHLNRKLHVEHIERAFVISKIRIKR